MLITTVGEGKKKSDCQSVNSDREREREVRKRIFSDSEMNI